MTLTTAITSCSICTIGCTAPSSYKEKKIIINKLMSICFRNKNGINIHTQSELREYTDIKSCVMTQLYKLASSTCHIYPEIMQCQSTVSIRISCYNISLNNLCYSNHIILQLTEAKLKFLVSRSICLHFLYLHTWAAH